MHTFFINDLIQLYRLLHTSNNQVFILRKTCTRSLVDVDIEQCAYMDAVRSQPVHRTATYKCDDTRCCIIKF